MGFNPPPISGGSSQPYQFLPESYGAKGDGKIVVDVATNTTTTITSATAAFTSGDVGKKVMINGGNGAGAAPVLSSIASVTNSTTAVLADAALATATNCQMVWGTDDTSAINQAVAAAATYATTASGTAGSGNYLAEIVFGSKIYLTSTLTQATSPVTYNTQIKIPYPNVNGQTRKLMITFRGAGWMAPAQYWESTAPNVQGSAIVSTLTAPSSVDPTFFDQSVIGGPSAATGFTGGFANTHFTAEGLSVWCPAYTNLKALYGFYLSGMHLDGYSSQIFAPANNTSAAPAAHPYMADFPPQALFQNSHGVGIEYPVNQNNDASTFGSICVEGYEIGLRAVDHLTGVRYAGLYCDVILKIEPGQSHEVAIQSVSAEQYNGGILVSAAGGNTTRLDIGWDSEVTSPTYDFSDSSNVAHGEVRFYDLFHTTPVVTGAANLRIRNDCLGPGYWSGAPAVAATTVNVQNTAWRDATVIITSGGAAVSAVTVDGQATGLTLGVSGAVTVRVPAGKNINLTYASTAPTWKWWLD